MERNIVEARALVELSATLDAQAQVVAVADGDAQPVRLRTLPYPFDNYVGIASDCDSSRLDGLVAVGALVRERFALPLADSFFPKWACDFGTVSRDEDAGAFSTAFDPCRFVERAFDWLRLFHDGGVDVIHGWIPRTRIAIGNGGVLGSRRHPAARLARFVPGRRDAFQRRASRWLLGRVRRSMDVCFDVPETWHAKEPPRYLYFEAEGPLAGGFLSVTLRVRGEERAKLDTGQVAAARVGACEFLVDLVRAVPGDPGDRAEIKATFTLVGDPEAEIVIRRPTLLTAIRADILRHRAVLEAFNLRVSTYTSHGGGYDLGRRGAVDWRAADPRVLADDPRNPHYALDVFREYGIEFFNTANNISIDRVLAPSELVFPMVLNSGEIVYDFHKYMAVPGDGDLREEEQRASDGYGINPSFSELLGFQVRRVLAEACEPGQGALIYTHNQVKGRTNPTRGSSDPDTLLNEDTLAALEQLSGCYYGLDAAPGRRVYVAPTSVLLRYAHVGTRLAAQARYMPASNAVHVQRWHDPVLGRFLPDPAHPASDLHAQTFYVDDAQTARLFVDGEEVDTLVRNAADASGAPSVTCVNDAVATAVLHAHAEPDASEEGDGVTCRRDDTGLRFTLTEDAGRIRLRAPGVSLTHHHYVLVRFSKSSVDLDFAVTLLGTTECYAFGECRKGTDVHHALAPWRSDDARCVVVPFHALTCGRSCGVPSGPLEAVEIALSGRPDDTLRLVALELLRDTAERPPPSVILGGRIPDELDVERVELAAPDRELAADLVPGAYVFRQRVPRGAPVEVRALLADGRRVAPLRGTCFPATRNALDVDF